MWMAWTSTLFLCFGLQIPRMSQDHLLILLIYLIFHVCCVMPGMDISVLFSLQDGCFCINRMRNCEQFCREVNILHQQLPASINAVHKVNDPLVNYQLDLFFQCSLSSQTIHISAFTEAKDLHQCVGTSLIYKNMNHSIYCQFIRFFKKFCPHEYLHSGECCFLESDILSRFMFYIFNGSQSGDFIGL